MKQSPLIRTFFPSFFTVFLISIFIVFAIMEYRHTKNLFSQYEAGIQQIALSNTNRFLDDINNITVDAARRIEVQNININQHIDTLIRNPLIKDVYVLTSDGNIIAASNAERTISNSLVSDAAKLKKYTTLMSPVHDDKTSGNKLVTIFTPLPNYEQGILVIDFSLEKFQNMILQDLISKNFTVAVFDQNGNAVFWPFEDKLLSGFVFNQESYVLENKRYNVLSAQTDNAWLIYFFFPANNIEIFRAITVLLLVFALYVCLYELLVEYWGVNTAKTYFENIDFAIFNQINEGVIIANNSGRILFANETAHHMFAERKNLLRNVRLKEILGNVDLQRENYGSQSFSLKLSDKLLKAIHSPIIKNNKILGSLTVLRNEVDGDTSISHVMDKVFESIPQGIIFVNKQHEISQANLIAKCYFANLIKGISIELVDRELADFIYKNIDSGSVKRVQLSSGVTCEVTPVHDEDGIYVGTVVYILSETTAI
ncbi:cache domain-containing protein [Desulforamulus ferrireducens]|uniref:PAS domain-containing protein n=1 Tax=Desulforamulus ferrireducens TaxID=1833852 RepID=A0A1S6IWU4_9FIRM|nr:cache domain-containing protein [Desulforamulus ferrireducens]AQS59243.1 hypothetical protein B0537_09210 [Desulforamulus ferrireducens]